jgi:hypothetical protein
MFNTSLEIIASLLMVRFVAMEALYQRAKRTKSGLRFPVGIGIRIMLRVGGPFLFFVAYKILEHGVTKATPFIAILIAVMGLACILGEPGEITTGPEGIKQRKMLGLQRKLVPWERAAGSCVRSEQRIYEILVIGRNGVSIAHSQYHVGQDTFLLELQRHKVFLQGCGS